ncbi:WD40/YVTN/BNR-like repeat-containing protein [Aquibaculum arenosum]|uniref:Exo-alpha-sialidase n=1 Tax=Aquibaculum arenosum TaxID=3032591 RepID=A0ABT5YQG8_9PROT|nr:exo-alpha-sialidase [Fodinicurvata sp. CAU 1616]MDF2097204.1 exo-alpha-sialidase [Fodinicurvata sp. CAU 1616]
MATKVLILLGTKKGVFIFESDYGRRSWQLRGPYCQTWPVYHVVADPGSGTLYAGAGDPWFGPAVWRSDDLGETWSHSSEGLVYGEGEDPVQGVWSLAPAHGRLYAGVGPAGLFVSDDRGSTWSHLEGLRAHPSRPQWQAGAAGLILHSLLPHPSDPQQIWIAISAAGVFHTADGGGTWEPRNRGTRSDYLPEDQRYPEFGQCVHSLAMAPGRPDRLYQQNHCGMYRSDDGGQAWQSIEAGLPSTFGFPSAVDPKDEDTLYLVPLNGDIAGRYMPEGQAAVWRTRDGGRTWQDLREGLPQRNVYFNVLRQALATDGMDPLGVYFGTSSGSLYASDDGGDTWRRLAEHLPLVQSVETLVIR